jgi:hypothetical protein
VLEKDTLRIALTQRPDADLLTGTSTSTMMFCPRLTAMFETILLEASFVGTYMAPTSSTLYEGVESVPRYVLCTPIGRKTTLAKRAVFRDCGRIGAFWTQSPASSIKALVAD